MMPRTHCGRYEPRVSILLPARDAGRTLETCLRSLTRQTEPRWECILIDDGSRDDTAERARAFAQRDSRIAVISTPPRGLVQALTTGLEVCRAPLVARMDADDWMHQRRLEEQCAQLDANPEWAATGCHVRLFPRAHLRGGRRRYENWLNAIHSPEDVARDAFVECPIAHPTLMARRETFDAFPYRNVAWPEDYDWLLRVLGAGKLVGVLPARRLAWRDGEHRLSRTDPTYSLERFSECKAAHLVLGLLRDTPVYVLWGYGETGRRIRRALAALGRLPSHIVEVHPRRLGKRIHGASVVAPEALLRLEKRPIVASVAGEGPRARIRQELSRMGFRECVDFVCAA